MRVKALFLLLFFSLLYPVISRGNEADSLKKAGNGPDRKGFHMKFELKREATDHGVPGETTKSSVKIDALLPGVVSLVRVEVFFPDEDTDFDGNLFNPRLGDINTRIGFHSIPLIGLRISSFIELTWPTADPSNLGMGKYQGSIGIKTNVRLSKPDSIVQAHKFLFDGQVQQVVSYAGDESSKDINYTKFEFYLKDVWRKLIWMKLTAKPVINWESKANTGSVAELELGWIISHNFSVWVMGGRKLWGNGIPGTYENRLSFSAEFQF